MKAIILMVLCFFATLALADTTTVAPAIVTTTLAPQAAIGTPDAPRVSTTIPAAAQQINQLTDKIPTSLPGWAYAVIGLLGTLLIRVFPTTNPQSIEKWIGLTLKAVGNLVLKLSELLDTIVQNSKSGGGDSA